MPDDRREILETLFEPEQWTAMNTPYPVDPSDKFMSAIQVDEEGNYYLDLTQDRSDALKWEWNVMNQLYNHDGKNNEAKAALHPDWDVARVESAEAGNWSTTWAILSKNQLKSSSKNEEPQTTEETKETAPVAPEDAGDEVLPIDSDGETQAQSDTSDTQAQTSSAPIAPPDEAKEEVNLEITTAPGDAEGTDLFIGDERVAGLLSEPHENEYGEIVGKTGGNPIQLVVTIPNDDGSVTVSYYDTENEEDLARDSGNNIVDTPLNQVTYNKDGSKVQVETDIANTHEQTTTKTTADGQKTVVVQDAYGNLTHVEINGESYTHKTVADQELWVMDGYEERGAKSIMLDEEGNIIIQNGSDENPYVRKYDSFGSLKELNVNNLTYDMSEFDCKFADGYFQYSRYNSSNGENMTAIKVSPFTVEVTQITNGVSLGEIYNSKNGELTGLRLPSDSADMAHGVHKNDDGTYTININGNTVPLEQGEDGHYCIPTLNTTIFGADGKLTIGNAQVQFTGSYTQGTDENGYDTYSGMTQQGYTVVTTDGNGNTLINYYNDEKMTDEPKRTIIHYQDGSKIESYKTKNSDGEVINVILNTDSNGKMTTAAITEKSDGSKVEARTSSDGQSMGIYYDKDGNITSVVAGSVEYEYGSTTTKNDEVIKTTKMLEDGSFVVVDNGRTMTYSSDGSLAKLEVNGQTYDMSEYKYENGVYKKILSTDGKYTQEISINISGEAVVTNKEADSSKNDSVAYDKEGNVFQYNIDGQIYTPSNDGSIVDSNGNSFEITGPDQWGRYSAKKVEE